MNPHPLLINASFLDDKKTEKDIKNEADTK